MTKAIQWLLVCAWANVGSAAWAQDDMHWYKNETTCAGVNVTVYSYCQNESDTRVNSFCVEQKITFVDTSGKKTTKTNLLDEEPARGDFHALGSIRCVAGQDNKSYLYMILDNGGNCDTCEIDAVMDLTGKWMRYDRKWFVRGKERRDIQKREHGWFHNTPAFYLHNKLEVESQP